MSDQSNPVLEGALAYAARGWPVLPLRCAGDPMPKRKTSEGKEPRIAGGCHGATTDPDLIRQWWSKWPDAGVGIATGERSKLLVIDVDPRNGGDDTLHELVHELGPLPDTAVSLTGDGQHLVFAHPGVPTRGTLGPGIDVRGEGGYVVAPPSVHHSGRAYAWESSSDPMDPDDPSPIAGLPPAWLERVSRSQGLRDLGIEGLSGVPKSLRTEGDGSGWPDGVDALIAETLPAEQGQRNACLGRLVGGLKVDLGLTLPPVVFRKVVDEWYRLASERVLMTATADDNFAEAETWWEHRAYGAKGSPAPTAFERAEAGRPWKQWEHLWPDETTRHLVAGLIELQAMVGPGVAFCGSSYVFADHTGAEQRATHGRLDRLVKVGLLELVARGTRGANGRANRYRVVSTPDEICTKAIAQPQVFR